MNLLGVKVCKFLAVAFTANAALIGLACAQSEPEIDIGTPAIALLRSSMANRFSQLQPHLQAGMLGLTHDGSVAFRDTARIEKNALLAIEALIIDENKDRATLYREIARANRRPEWEADLRATFAKKWISRMPAGWFYRTDKGEWIRKE